MQTEITEKLKRVGSMQKRRVLMADERRYLIYYTFEPLAAASSDGRLETDTLGESAAAKGKNENV